MKRVFAIGIVIIVCIFGIFYLFDVLKLNKEDYEFTAFQTFLDENFFPVLNDAFKHLDQAADEIEDETFLNWYLELDGIEENREFQTKIEETEKNVLDEEVIGSDSLLLKKNILEQIAVLHETFELLYNAAQANDITANEIQQAFISQVEELSNLSEEMSTILEDKDEIEKVGSF